MMSEKDQAGQNAWEEGENGKQVIKKSVCSDVCSLYFIAKVKNKQTATKPLLLGVQK